MSNKFPLALTNLPLVYQGKTRDTYRTVSDRYLLIVASDRLSTHNVVHHSLVPRKGEILTALTVYWLRELLEKRGINHHLVAHGRDIYPYLPDCEKDYPTDLHLRAIVVRNLRIIPKEMILRAYLSGSLYSNFYGKGLPNPYGIEIPPGLAIMTKFEKPIFTPTDKSETDDPCVSADVEAQYPEAVEVSRSVFNLVRTHLNRRGIELVDSKFEIGGRSVVADEVATPDSSRFVSLADVKEGEDPQWFDKQIARDAAEVIWAGGKKYPIDFDVNLLSKLSATYERIFELATGMSLRSFQQDWLC